MERIQGAKERKEPGMIECPSLHSLLSFTSMPFYILRICCISIYRFTFFLFSIVACV
jgi:hypothetical protein